MLLSLVIPTYNERQNIALLVQSITPTLEKTLDHFEIIVVDDDSPDGTWQVVDELAKDNPRLAVIRRRGDKGLATAVVAGWQTARGALLGVMDGDLQHPPEVLPVLLRTILDSQADIVIASRNVEGGWGKRMETHPQAHRLGCKIYSHSNAPWGRKICSGSAVGIFSDEARCHRIRRPQACGI